MSKSRKDREYPVLGCALKSLKHSEFAMFYATYGKLQIGWHVFCSREEWNEFHEWIKPQIIALYSRKISYKVFRDELADYIERMSNPKTHEKLILLARDAFNCEDENILYDKGKRLFGIIK